MMSSRWTLLTSAALVTLLGLPAEAQIGGLIKRKVGEAVKGPEKAAESPKADTARHGFVNGNEDVLEITPPVLEGVMRGLKVEIALRKDLAAELATYPTREQYQACQTRVAMSEESQKLLAIMDLPDNATAEQQQKAMEKYAAEGVALLKKRCPLNPADAPNRETRLAEIQEKAAAAAGPEEPSGERDHDSAPSESEWGLGEPSAGPYVNPPVAAGLTARQYAILLERIKRFCEELQTAAGKGLAGSGGVKIPGSGNNVFWVYTATEAKTLSENNCQRVNDLIGQLI